MKRAIKTLSKEEWASVEDRIGSGFFGSVELLVDGYTITLERQLVSKNRMGIMTFVNGVFKPAWCLKKEGPSEEARRFFNTKKISRQLRGKERRKAIRACGKRFVEEKLDHTYSYPTPIWKSVRALRNHFEANNDSIEWTKPQPMGLAKEAAIETAP